MSPEGKELVDRAEKFAGSAQAMMVPGLSAFLRALANYIKVLEERKNGST